MAGIGSDEPNLSNAKAAVERIVSSLRTRFHGFNISEIIKAGSLGHGTVVPGNYDIDLVLYSRDIRAEVVYDQNGYKTWLTLLKSFIASEPNVSNVSYNPWFVQFLFQYRGVRLDVDLLVSPYWDTPQDFYEFLRRIPTEKRHLFTVCASKWQVRFFQNTENQVKEYIKRAKAWRNRVWSNDEPGKPKSYLMSLLVVKAYEKCGDMRRPQDVTRELKALVKSSSIDEYWRDGIYRIADYRDLVPDPPRIIDPANPANNVWKSGFKPYGKSSVLVSKIDTIDLSRPIN